MEYPGEAGSGKTEGAGKALRFAEYIVFITDGQCKMPDDFLEELRKEQTERRFTITGILLDSDSPGMEFSLKAFCQNIYRTSELAGEDIVRELVGKRV